MNDSKIILDIRDILNALDIKMERLIESQVLDSGLNQELTLPTTSGPSPVFDQPITPTRTPRQLRTKKDSSQSL